MNAGTTIDQTLKQRISAEQSQEAEDADDIAQLQSAEDVDEYINSASQTATASPAVARPPLGRPPTPLRSLPAAPRW